MNDFAAGDEVFGFLPYSPFSNRGAFAQALVARTDEIAKKRKEREPRDRSSGKMHAHVTAVGSGKGLALAQRLGVINVKSRAADLRHLATLHASGGRVSVRVADAFES